MSKKSLLALAVTVTFVAGLATVVAYGAADKILEVKVGTNAANAKEAKEHDLTLEKLTDGKTIYMVKHRRQEYKIVLTERQIEDILEGTTVMVSTVAEGNAPSYRVTITIKEAEKKKDTGW